MQRSQKRSSVDKVYVCRVNQHFQIYIVYHQYSMKRGQLEATCRIFSANLCCLIRILQKKRVLDGKYPTTATFPCFKKLKRKLQFIFSYCALPFLIMLYKSKFL